jgi:hypothetical protein
LVQDRPLEALEIWSRVDSQFIGKSPVGLLVNLEGLCLPSSAVQREHQMTAESLTERMFGNEGLQIADHLGALSQGEIGFDSALERVEAKLAEPFYVALGERLVGKVGKRLTPPQLEGLAENRGSRPMGAPIQGLTALLQQSLEALSVELFGRHTEHITRLAALDRRWAIRLLQDLPEPGDIRLDHVQGSAGRVFPPEILDEAIRGNDLVRMNEEDGQQGLLLGTP